MYIYIQLARSAVTSEDNSQSSSRSTYGLKETVRIDQLRAKERQNSRPFYMEHIDVEIYEVDKAVFGSGNTGKLIKTGLNSIGGGGAGLADQGTTLFCTIIDRQ
jgi:hypothetical protein